MNNILKKYRILILLTLFGTFLRLYNLLWGAPYFFHPDERNIVYAIMQLSFPHQLNPHFFAYGSLPIYTIFLIANFFSLLTHKPFDFAFIVLLLRLFSAVFSILLIPSLYTIAEKLFSKRIAILAAFLCTWSVGFVQYAHFGTFEMWSTFFTLWLFYFSLQLLKNPTVKNIFITSSIMGILLAIKISNLPLFIFPLICYGIFSVQKKSLKISALFNLFIFFAIIGFIYLATNPFALLDGKDFLGSMHYESSVALGTLPVFYTGSFFNTTPIIFQLTKVYPFLLNPLVTACFVVALFFTLFSAGKQKNTKLILLNFYFLLLFLSQAFLFVKWTRYMIPTLPFIYLITANMVEGLSLNVKRFTYVAIGLVSLIFTLSFVKTAYMLPDTRVVAAAWARENIPSSRQVLTEPYDLGVLPFNDNFPNSTLLPLYDIDRNYQALNIVKRDLSTANIFILPSQRLIHSRLLHKNTFPVGYALYANLLANKTAYKKDYETPCDIYCKITYMGDPLFSVEETASVFDRPTVMIFEKE